MFWQAIKYTEIYTLRHHEHNVLHTMYKLDINNNVSVVTSYAQLKTLL